MSNIIDYVKWRVYIEFKYDGFNEIYNVILSRLSYFDFSKCLGKYDDEILLDEAYRRYSKLNPQEKNILWKDDDELFPLMALSKRYQDLKLTRFVNKIDEKKQQQFSAITIILPNMGIFVSFRGTDNTIVGWKEDFNLSFQDNVPAQIESVKYLKEVSNVYPNAKIMLGGHSKGGNLAIYSASFCEDDNLQKRIIGIYNNDGPGLSVNMSEKDGYKNMLSKMHTYIPQSSVVGRLLTHEEKYSVIESTQMGIMQHDVYSWQLEGVNLNHLDEVDNGSEIIDKTLKEWLNGLTNEEREKFVDTMFGLLADTNVNTVNEMKTNKIDKIKIIINNYKNINEETRENLNKAMLLFWNTAKNNIFKRNRYRIKKTSTEIKNKRTTS